jgi:hypothetical protein
VGLCQTHLHFRTNAYDSSLNLQLFIQATLNNMTVESNKRPLSSLSDTPPSKRPCKEKPCSKMDDAIAAMLEQHNLEFRNALERARHVQTYNEKHDANER